MERVVSKTEAETEALGEKLAKTLMPGSTVALFGGMGMGKTVFTRGLAKGFGVEKGVSSPTFTIVREYHGRIPVYHFDMFRITGFEDLYSSGFFDYVGGDGIVVVEWSENVEEYLPEHSLKIRISRGASEEERIFEIGEGEEK